jgi:hypothetical protein
MKRPVRTTLVYGLISALAVTPSAWLLAGPIGWQMAFKLSLWLDLVIYAILLARWSGKGLMAVAFPMALSLGTVLWPGVYAGFFFLALGVFSWIRSGICFSGTPVRAAAAEILTVAGGAGLVTLLNPGSSITWSVSIWLFFLVQALYFFIVRVNHSPGAVPVAEDPFERACREAKRVLDGG